jgi:hypothetical protein
MHHSTQSSFDNEPEVAMEVDIVVVHQRIAPFPQHMGFPDVSLMVTVIVFLFLLLLGALVDRVVLVVHITADIVINIAALFLSLHITITLAFSMCLFNVQIGCAVDRLLRLNAN